MVFSAIISPTFPVAMATRGKSHPEVCQPTNINVNTTVDCHTCKGKFHLPCFDIIQPASKLFVSPNIVFLCDDCLTSCENSPKRKGAKSPKVLKQTVLSQKAGILSSQTTPVGTMSKKPVSNEHLRMLIEKLSKKCDSSFASLKTSVDSVHDTISSNKIQIDESLKKNDADLSSVTKTIVEKLDTFEKKQSFSQVLSASLSSKQKPSVSSPAIKPLRQTSSVASKAVTKSNPVANKYKSCPLISGTNEVISQHIGKEVTITKRKRKNSTTTAIDARPKLSKAVYVTRFQPGVTVDGVMMYLNSQIPDLVENKVAIRMLVKKDQDVNELQFISFRISCTEDLFPKLSEPAFWPSYIKMREFVFEPKKPRVDPPSEPTKVENPPSEAAVSNSTKNHDNDVTKNVSVTPLKPSNIVISPSKIDPATKTPNPPATQPPIINLVSPKRMDF